MRIALLFFYLFCCVDSFFAQTMPKRLVANRTQNSVKIDGVLDEVDWFGAERATDFVQNDPLPGAPASQKSEVYILYDNQSVYVGAMLYDTQPDSILQELSERDRIGNTDWFGILIDAYRDGQNATGFYVTAAGVQVDIKYSAADGSGGSNVIFSGDTNWDAVWESKTNITEEGWVVEMRLPYSVLRFPKAEEQRWHINLGRSIRRYREQVFWNEVNPQEAGFVQQAGKLSGIKNIKSPIRLSATPFVAAYVENYHDTSSDPKTTNGYSVSGGMDVKYGINDAFTLDMTLIPDFGEAQSDNQVQNLSPFEIFFDENRPFFTEGIELFNKGNLFYSRRVGGRPLYYWNIEDGEGLADGEVIANNPTTTQLFNATKVSGRTKKGLGIGIFNAVADKAYATVRHEETGRERNILTNPLTNYNVLVFDQNLKNNSFATIINTNVLREGEAYDANVTGGQFNLRNKDNSYAVNGRFALSQKYNAEETDLGHTYNIGVEKISGAHTWELFYNVETDDYDPNDLGFLLSPNERQFGGQWRYNKYEPFWNIFNSGGWSAGGVYNRLHTPSRFVNAEIWADAWVRTKKFTSFFVWGGTSPLPLNDYFEPRTDDFSRYYKLPEVAWHGFWVSTDYRKKFAIDVNGDFRHVNEHGRFNYNAGVQPRFRINNKFSIFLGMFYREWFNDVGYVNTVDEAIVFGRRDRHEVENSFRANYAFNNNMTLSFRMRHYWANVKYLSYHKLGQEGELLPHTYDTFSDNTFNAFNIDAIYRWRFAPGSDIFIIWKNTIIGSDDEASLVTYSYPKGLDRLGGLPQSNSLSIKVIYFLDYVEVVSKK